MYIYIYLYVYIYIYLYIYICGNLPSQDDKVFNQGCENFVTVDTEKPVILIIVSQRLMQGYYSKQYCCIYCRSVNWVYEDENQQLRDYLYTSFGPAALHRNTCHA